MTRSKIAENTIFLTVSGAASVLFTLAQLSILTRFLSGDDLGLFLALRGFSLLLGAVILLGLPQVLVRFFPTFEARSEAGKALFIFFLSSAVVAALGVALYFASGFWERLMPSGVRGLIASREIVAWLALSSVTLALKMLLYGGFNGLREMRLQMLLEIVYLAAFTAYMIVERDRLTVEMLFAAMFVLNLGVFAAGIPVLVRRSRRGAPPAGAAPEGIVVPNLFSYWAGSFCLSIVALAFTDVDRFVMSSVVPMASISLFHVASRVDVLIKRFLGLPILAAQPEITRVYEEGRWDDISGRIGLFTKGMVAAALLCTAFFAVIGRDVIILLSGKSYVASYRILLILLPTVPLAAVSAPLMATMRSLHFIKWAVICDFLWMAGYFGTFFIFVSAMGVEGMAVSQVLASIIQMAAAILLAKRGGFFGGIGSRIGRLLAALAVVVPCGMFATSRVPLYASLVFVAAAPFAARFIIARLRVFDQDEKEQIIDLVKIKAGRRIAAWMLSAAER
ncbi:MAG: lipopolysaccharide biosynthesis protein [Candidatus Krumholzibacteria bacterium]|nr:lipopolysaccharide biosynthesis protein [Candidatus Krumholzibacteria bacterium]